MLLNRLPFLLIILLSGLLLMLPPQKADAQLVTLSLGSSIDFPSANPATVPSIGATQNPIAVGVTVLGIGLWSLTILASSDLTSGANTISISSVHYALSGISTASGALTKGLAITLGSGSLSLSPPQTGEINFYFDNSWDYPTGVYTTSLLVTAIVL